MNKRRFTCFTLSLIACASANVGVMPLGIAGSAFMQPALAAPMKAQSATGLDAHSLQLANRGVWPELIDRLQSLTQDATAPTPDHAWLAFGYMFQDRCEDLKSLDEKVQRLATDDKSKNIAKTVEVYNLVCQKKYDDAEKLGAELTTNGQCNDVATCMALAAVSAKSGNAAKAIDYCKQAVTLAPDFAWGYRTIGFIEERSLKDRAAAEQAYDQALAIQPDCKEVRDLLVDQHIARNDFDGAIDVATAGIKTFPHDPMNYYRLSQIYTQQWRLREADDQLGKAIRLAPDNARFHRAKASILRYENKLTEAIAEQKRAVDLSSDKPFELTELAALNELAGNDSAAADNLKQALSLAPVSQAAYQAAHQRLVQLLLKGQRWDDLIAEYTRAIQVQPDKADLHLGLADAYIKTNKITEAMGELKKASELDQNDARPQRVLGALCLQQREFPAAIRAYTRALNINPGSVEDLVALGYTYAANNDYMQAETAFVTALALQQLTNARGSNREDVMRSLATLLLSEGRYTEAAMNYEEIIRTLKGSQTEQQDALMFAESKALRDRTNAAAADIQTAFNALPEQAKEVQRAGVIDSLLRLGKADAALDQLAAVAQSARQQAQWLILEARADRMKGDFKKSEEAANKAVAANDPNKDLQAAAYVELAHALLDKGDLDGADNAVRKATGLNDKSFYAYEVMGRIYLKRGDTDHAIEAAKHATDINPYYTPAYILTGDAYQKSNKLDQAANNYKRAVELYPANIDAHRSLRDVYKKLAQKDEAQKEDQLITQMEQKG